MIEKGLAAALPEFSSPDGVVSNLLLREILRETAVGYHFHNEMFRRWFKLKETPIVKATNQ